VEELNGNRGWFLVETNNCNNGGINRRKKVTRNLRSVGSGCWTGLGKKFYRKAGGIKLKKERRLSKAG